MNCRHCGEQLVVVACAYTDLGGQTFCGDGITRHQPTTNTTVVAASPTLGWLQQDTYEDPWGRRGLSMDSEGRWVM